MLNDPNDFRANSYLAQPNVRASLAGAFTHDDTGNWKAVLYSAENFDAFDLHNVSSNTSRLTLSPPGRWIVGGGCAFAANATGQRGLRVSKNGTVVPGGQFLVDAAAAGTTNLGVANIVNIVAGDYIELETFQNSGGNLDHTANRFWAQRVG